MMAGPVHRYALRLVFPLLLIVLGAACRHRAMPAEIPKPKLDQVARGKILYDAHCANCHDLEKGIGPRLTKDVLATHVTAMALFNYTRRSMPYATESSLAAQEYWDMTAYLLSLHGFIKRDVVLGPETAEGVSLVE